MKDSRRECGFNRAELPAEIGDRNDQNRISPQIRIEMVQHSLHGHLKAPVRRFLWNIPTKYGDIWTGAKGFYKVEPVVADGGQVILYAPHITEISVMHRTIAQIGYHCRDYFLGQWDEFSGYHWGDLAHSTHLRGAGTWDPVTGEKGGVTVTLATGIPEHVVRAANLDCLNPVLVDRAAMEADPDTPGRCTSR